jgi:SAM-dependent methyltransferase
MALETLVKSKNSRGEKIRLHLGCGSRIFDGYINVDGEYMKHHPDVIIHDITQKFSLPDDSVDEILTVHVLEHITRSRVADMLREWHRILRPGGFAAVEWPDFLKMCREVAANPDCLLATADRRLQKRTVLGIYGDNERYPDPVMWHKWGYSEHSMTHLFQSVGFGTVRAEPNHHSKTPNDSRVVAYK